jgi:AraC family transcriptional regulator
LVQGSDRQSAYHARMQRVLRHVDSHLDEDLSIEVLSGVAAFSRHHFQRQFAALFGVTPQRYVQLLRLKRASQRLAFASADVMQAALDSGYEGPEAFARAFKRALGQTPSSFRTQPDWIPWQAALGPVHKARSKQMTTDFSDDQVRIVDFPATSVALMEHRGDPALIGDTIRRFIAWRKRQGLPPAKSATFNILHFDPEQCAPGDYRIDICAGTEREIDANAEGVAAGLIPEGRCAVLRATGATEDLRPAVSFLYGEWLPRSGEEMRDFPLFVQRVSFYPEVPEHEAVTDIFLPLV